MMPVRKGFTVIEVLIVVLIIGVIASIVLVLYQTVNGVRTTQSGIARGSAALNHAYAVLSKDLTCTFNSEQEGTAFELQAPADEERGSSSLRFCASLRNAAEREFRWAVVHRIRYAIDGTGSEPALVRVAEPLHGPGSLGGGAETNELLRPVSRFFLEVYDGKDWSSDWDSVARKGLPMAARITIGAFSSGNATQKVSKVYIPAGNAIKSSLQRVHLP
jgi:type II secretion system protein J